MNTIKFSFDGQSFRTKPSGDEIRRINNRIARSAQKLDRDAQIALCTAIDSVL